MADYWIKLYLEIIDDPKMATLPDRLWRRAIELFLLAGKLSKDKSGVLPETRQLAWLLRLSTDELQADLQQLELTGIVQRVNNDGWLIVNFAKRQAASSNTERVREFRKRKQSAQYNDDETHEKRFVAQINRLTESESESESEAEREASPPPPTQEQPPDFTDMSPVEARKQPGVRQFCKVTGRYPARAQLPIIWRRCRNMGTAQMQPAWDEWVSRGYRVDNLGWLEWVEKGIPIRAVTQKKNGGMSEDEFRATMQAEAERLEREGF